MLYIWRKEVNQHQNNEFSFDVYLVVKSILANTPIRCVDTTVVYFSDLGEKKSSI